MSLGGAPGVLSSLSGAPISLPALSGTRQCPLGHPQKPPLPSAQGQEPTSVCPGAQDPPGALSCRPQDPQLPAPPESLRVRPFPSPSLAEPGGRRAVRTQDRPSRRGCKCDVSQAKPAPPPTAPATGAAGAARGVRQGCRANLNTPGGRYLVGGHRAEALEDGHDVLLAGVPHGHQRTEGADGPANWEELTRSGCRLPELDDGPGVGLRVTARPRPRPRPQVERTRRSPLRASLSGAAGSAHWSPHPALHARAQKAPAPFPGPRLPSVQGSGWRT